MMSWLTLCLSRTDLLRVHILELLMPQSCYASRDKSNTLRHRSDKLTVQGRLRS